MAGDEQPRLVDPSGTPVETTPGLRERLGRPGVTGWTLIVLGVQALALLLQLLILQRQTTLMGRDASIAETQQKLGTRPIIVVRQINPMEGVPNQVPGWVIENNGSYPVRNLTIRLFHFKKFVGLGWHANAGSEALLLPELGAGQSHPLDLKALTDFVKQYDITGYTAVPFADFIVTVIGFRRDVDDKRYLYLVPFQVIGDIPKMIRPEFTSMSGRLGNLA